MPPKRDMQRKGDWLLLYEGGLTLAEIAIRYDVSPQCVQQYLKRSGKYNPRPQKRRPKA